MNILILSAGTRNKVVQYYKEALKGRGKIIATDCSLYAPAIYDADAFEIVPMITAPDYLDIILGIVKKYEIKGCFSLIDPELSLLAKERDRFLELGCTPMISPYELVETCFHKFKTYQMFTEYGLPTAKCYMSLRDFDEAYALGEVDFPVFVKPENGSASLQINQATDREEIAVLMKHHENLMIQEFMHGQEYGADVYIDMISGKCVSIFLKKKLKMRAGETDKSVSVHDEALFTTIKDMVEKAGFRGQIDIDLFHETDENGVELADGKWYFSEINPRYGGGYPHAYLCGVDTPTQYITNLSGQANEEVIGQYPDYRYMMKYNEIAIIQE